MPSFFLDLLLDFQHFFSLFSEESFMAFIGESAGGIIVSTFQET